MFIHLLIYLSIILEILVIITTNGIHNTTCNTLKSLVRPKILFVFLIFNVFVNFILFYGFDVVIDKWRLTTLIHYILNSLNTLILLLFNYILPILSSLLDVVLFLEDFQIAYVPLDLQFCRLLFLIL